MSDEKDTTGNQQGEEYIVGQGKPPREYQFKKGTSGNPAGRPKGIISFQDRIRKLCDEEINYTDISGKEKKTKVGDMLIASMIKKVMKEDDVSAARLLIEHLDGKALQKTQEVPATLEDALNELEKEDE